MLLVQMIVPVVTAGHWVAVTILLTRRKIGALFVPVACICGLEGPYALTLNVCEPAGGVVLYEA